MVREHERDDSPYREWLSLLSRQRWVVVGTVAAATLAAAGRAASDRRTRRRRQRAREPAESYGRRVNLGSAPASPPDRYVATQAALARVGKVAQMTVDAAHVPG